MAREDQKTVLMADDDADDCMLAAQAFAESGGKAAFDCVANGNELLLYLSERSHSDSKRLPDLILLDLNMPRKDGREALLEINSRPALRHIPIVILSTSKENRDIDFTTKAEAKSFITKPSSFGKWVEIMSALRKEWLTNTAE
jgi:CheY-like chemotaxis protein